MKLRKIVSGIGEVVNAMRLSRCTAALSIAGFTNRKGSSKENEGSTRSWEPENSISVLEYLERLKGEDAGGQETGGK